MATVCGSGGGWFFFCALFPWKKSAKGARQVGARVHPHSSSSELSPHQMARPQFSDGSMPGYFWRDAAGRVWMRSFAFPGTWVCSGEDGEDNLLGRAWVGGGSCGGGGRSGGWSSWSSHRTWFCSVFWSRSSSTSRGSVAASFSTGWRRAGWE